MPTSSKSSAVRRAAPAVALTSVLLVVTCATPAFASAPEGWPEVPEVNPLHALLVIVLIPLAIAAVLTLLTYLPSMVRGESAYQPGLAWRHEPEWFGGPRDGLEKADRPEAGALEGSGDRGGASGHW